MSRFDYVYPEVGDFRDVIIEAEFESPLLPTDSLHVLAVIVGVTESPAAQRAFFGNIESLFIDTKFITLTLRFPLKPEFEVDGDPAAEEALARARLHFILHVFGKIDQQFRIVGMPNRPDFREFVDL